MTRNVAPVPHLKMPPRHAGMKSLVLNHVVSHGASNSILIPVSHCERMVTNSESCTSMACVRAVRDVDDVEVASHPDWNSLSTQPGQSGPKFVEMAPGYGLKLGRTERYVRGLHLPIRPGAPPPGREVGSIGSSENA